MSRVGKNPVAVPSGVDVKVDGRTVTAKGKLGQLSYTSTDDVTITLDGGQVTINPVSNSKQARAMWGTARARVQNLVTGVSEGFTKNLEITGVGYRAAVQGKTLNLQLGFSHDINYPIADGPLESRGGQAVGRTDGGGGARHARSRALQGQGRPLRRRADHPQGRQEEVIAMLSKTELLRRRARRVRSDLRKKARGRPRLSVFRSSKHIYAQVIDDVQGVTLASASSLDKDLRGQLKTGADAAAAEAVGKLLAERAKSKGVEQVVFDRGAYIYHGRVKALADAARSGGLNF